MKFIWWIYIGVAFAVFLVIEITGISTGWWPSLSRATWDLSKEYPLVPFVIGLIVGGLAVHFWGPSENPAQGKGS